MEYLFDTNIYRNLVRTLSLDEIPNYVEELKIKEDARDIKAGFSIVVAMELIKHLEKEDPMAEECFKALCLLVFHTQRYNQETNSFSGKFYPPLNVVLTKHFFETDSIYLNLYFQVLDTAHNLTYNYESSNCQSLQNEILAIKSQVLFEKQQLKSNIENFISSLNQGKLDWKYFKSNNRERKKWFNSLNTGRSTYLIAFALMKRAYQIMEVEIFRPDAEEKFNSFYNQYYPALLMNELLLEQIGHGTEALSDINDKRWNTINDVSIMFGMLYRSDELDKVLVTEEDKIRECFQMLGQGRRAINLNEFIELTS